MRIAVFEYWRHKEFLQSEIDHFCDSVIVESISVHDGVIFVIYRRKE